MGLQLRLVGRGIQQGGQGVVLRQPAQGLKPDLLEAHPEAEAAGLRLVSRETFLPYQVMLVFSRSGHGFNHAVRLANSVGVIDSDYRGEVKVKLACDDCPDDEPPLKINPGDRIAQAMVLPIPRVEFEEVTELSATARGQGGFGSTGR